MSESKATETTETTETTEITTKIAVVLRTDLATWQKLNMTAFLVSGIAAGSPESMGRPYADGDGNAYLPMFGQPTMIFAANADEMRRTLDRTHSRGVTASVFTDALFATGNDVDNRAAIAAVGYDDLAPAGLAFRCARKDADKITKGLRLHS